MTETYFKFIRYSLDEGMAWDSSFQNIDWDELFRFAKRQTIVGVLFEGIKRIPKEYAPPFKTLMSWMGYSEQIRKRNLMMNEAAHSIYEILSKDGFRCFVLKGQGNTLMYPNPYSRTPGDIDLLLCADRNTIDVYLESHFKIESRNLQHAEFEYHGACVEAHYFPAYLNNVFYNRRLQRWFRKYNDLQCSNIVELPDGAGNIAVPTSSYNVIFQLCHLYEHFFDEGIGMRQIIDYYYVLMNMWHTDFTDLTDSKVRKNNQYIEQTKEKVRVESVRSVCDNELKHLGLWEFAGAVMYVLHEALGLPEEKMIAPMDEKRGKLLLAEILNGGNFGRHFTKYGHFTQQGMAKKYFLKIWRNMHFVKYYPAEALSEPIFRTWHFFWRLRWDFTYRLDKIGGGSA